MLRELSRQRDSNKKNLAKENEYSVTEKFITEITTQSEEIHSHGKPEKSKEKSQKKNEEGNVKNIINLEKEKEEELSEEQICRRNYKTALLKVVDPKQKEFIDKKPALLRNQTELEVMSEISSTIGFKNISAQMIKDWAWEEPEETVESESDETMFNDPKYDAARKFLIINLCQYNLHIAPSQIIIDSVWSAEKTSSKILWEKASPNFVRFLFV